MTVGRARDDSAALRTALRLEYATVAWNVGEVFVTIWLGIEAGSIALVAFGLDSVVEIFASVVVLWDLRGTQERARTRRALRLVSVSFFVLGTVLAVGGVRNLVRSHRPDESVAGIAYLAATTVAMLGIARVKERISTTVGNHPLVHETRITYLDSMLSAAILGSLVVNAAFGWWWADPLAAIVVAIAAFAEGAVTPREH